MRETPADTTRAMGLAFLVHAVVFALVLMGMPTTEGSTVSAAEPAMAVGLIDPNTLSTAMKMALHLPMTSIPDAQPVEQATAPANPLPEPPTVPPPAPEPEQAQLEPPPIEHERIAEPDVAAQEPSTGDATAVETSAPATQ